MTKPKEEKMKEEKPRKITAYDILKSLSGGNFNTQSVVEVSEFSPYHSNLIRLDMFAWQPDKTWGYEIKVTKNDFKTDNKWQTYLNYCDFFYFVAPKGLIDLEELPEKVGLIEAFWHQNWQENNYLRTEIVRRAKKLEEVSEENKEKVLLGLIYKMAFDKNILKASL